MNEHQLFPTIRSLSVALEQTRWVNCKILTEHHNTQSGGPET